MLPGSTPSVGVLLAVAIATAHAQSLHCGGPAQGTLPRTARQLCLLTSQPDPQDSAQRRHLEAEPLPSVIEALNSSTAGHTRAASALSKAGIEWPHRVLSARRRTGAVQPQPTGLPALAGDGTSGGPGVIDVRLSSELQAAQHRSPRTNRCNGLGAALAAVLATSALTTCEQTQTRLLPVMLFFLLGMLVCGAIVLQGRHLRGGQPGRQTQQSAQRQPLDHGKVPVDFLDESRAVVPSHHSLGSSLPSFGSRPNTVGSVPADSRRDTLLPSDSSPRLTHLPRTSAETVASGRWEGASSNTSRLAPICEALVLPGNEAHLHVLFADVCEVSREDGEFYMLSQLGNRLLRVEVRRTAAGRAMDVSMVSTSDLLARHSRIVSVRTGESAAGFSVYTPDDRLYGELVPHEKGFALRIPGHQLPPLQLLVDDQPGLVIAISGENGGYLASSTINESSAVINCRLEVRVHAGVDTALVLSSILAAILFSKRNEG